jgi:CubicO group peptidase (beta-lactamase class C family)
MDRGSAMFEKIKQGISESGANVFQIALYLDGRWQHETLRASCPCLNCYSLSKSFTATAIGLAQDMGLLSLEDAVIQFFPDELRDKTDKKLEQVKIVHLLTQTMGNAEGYLFEHDRYTHNTKDWVRLVLSMPLEYEPGKKFAYSNSTYYLLACIIHKVSGMTLEMFLKNHLFGPMGISEFAWETCPGGETMGATGLYMSTPDVAKLGLLYLNSGEYEGRRLIPRKWAEDAVQTKFANERYGYSFWTNDIGYNAGGAYNQIVLAVPSENLVFAAHSYTDKGDFVSIVKDSL